MIDFVYLQTYELLITLPWIFYYFLYLFPLHLIYLFSGMFAIFLRSNRCQFLSFLFDVILLFYFVVYMYLVFVCRICLRELFARNVWMVWSVIIFSTVVLLFPYLLYFGINFPNSYMGRNSLLEPQFWSDP